jgi:hypothetical protein
VSFATIRHRTVHSKGCLSNKTALAMISISQRPPRKAGVRLDGHMPKVNLGVKFADGIEVSDRKLKSVPPDPFRHQAQSDGATGRFK